MTAFAVATGHRDWHVDARPHYPPSVWASRDTVFGFDMSSNSLVGLASDTGAERFSYHRD